MHITNTGTSRKNDKSKAVFMGTKSHKKLFFLSFLSDPDPIIVHPIRKTSLFLRGSAGPCARRLLISSHTNNLVELTSRPFRKLIEWPLLTKIFNRTLTHKLGNMQNMQYYWNCPDIRVTKAPSPIQTRRARPSWAPTSGSSRKEAPPTTSPGKWSTGGHLSPQSQEDATCAPRRSFTSSENHGWLP